MPPCSANALAADSCVYDALPSPFSTRSAALSLSWLTRGNRDPKTPCDTGSASFSLHHS